MTEMTERERWVGASVRDCEYELKYHCGWLRLRSIMRAGIYGYIERYFKFWEERAPRVKVGVDSKGEDTATVDLTPFIDDLVAAIKSLDDDNGEGWRRAFWLEQLEKYKRTMYRPPVIPLPPIVTPGGI